MFNAWRVRAKALHEGSQAGSNGAGTVQRARRDVLGVGERSVMTAPPPLALAFALALTVPLAVLAGSVSGAAAHAPPEVLQVVSSADADVILATNRGLMFGSRARGEWQLLCSEAFGVSTGSSYGTALLPSGRILIAEQGGLHFSDDRGCTWRRPPDLGKLSTPTLAQHPEVRDRLYLTIQGFDGTQAVPDVAGVRRSDDGGETFRTVYAASEGEVLQSLLVSAGEPGHVYASATVFGARGTEYVVLHSSDGGTSWRRGRVDADVTKETDITLLALNPRDPLEILARASGAELALGDRLLWSTDGGGTFTTLGSWPRVRSAAFSPDGASAFVSHRDGLLRAADGARTLEKLGASIAISSVVADATDLLACGYFAGPASPLDGVGIAPLSDPSARFQTLMTFDQVRAHARCAAPSTAERDCDVSWRDWATEQGLDPQTATDDSVPAGDAGQAEAGSGASNRDDDAPMGAADDSAHAKKSGCSLSGQSNVGVVGWLAIGLPALRLRRRRRKTGG